MGTIQINVHHCTKEWLKSPEHKQSWFIEGPALYEVHMLINSATQKVLPLTLQQVYFTNKSPLISFLLQHLPGAKLNQQSNWFSLGYIHNQIKMLCNVPTDALLWSIASMGEYHDIIVAAPYGDTPSTYDLVLSNLEFLNFSTFVCFQSLFLFVKCILKAPSIPYI